MSNQAEAMMQDQIEGAISENEALRQEVERLREALKTAQYRGMVDERISYKGYSYGMRSMSGIRDLRRAIERDKNY
jgi:regulator of replication initiation timing